MRASGGRTGSCSPARSSPGNGRARWHRVTITAEDFGWDGKTYKSLTQIAYAITGTRWNGPRFFGLRNKSARRRRLV